MIVGDFIRLWRNYHRLSQQQLADLVGVTRCTIGNWEAGKHQPQRAAWARFEKAQRKVDAARPCYTLSEMLRRPGPPFMAKIIPGAGAVLAALGSFTLNTKEAGA